MLNISNDAVYPAWLAGTEIEKYKKSNITYSFEAIKDHFLTSQSKVKANVMYFSYISTLGRLHSSPEWTPHVVM